MIKKILFHRFGIIKAIMIITVVALPVAIKSGDAAAAGINVSREISGLKNSDARRKLDSLGRLRKEAADDRKAGLAVAEEAKKEKNPHIRARLTEALGDFKQKETIDAAVEILQKDDSAQVRYAAAYALGYSGDPSAAPALIKTFTDENETAGVRFQAANALAVGGRSAGWPTEEIIEVFLKAMESPAAGIRSQAITSLAILAPDDKRTPDAVKKMMSDKDESVRNAAYMRAEVLGIK